MVTFISNPTAVRQLATEVLAAPGRPKIMPAAFYQNTSVVERAVFGALHGIYGMPTEELVNWLQTAIGGRSAIEIGAGHGGLAAALGIRATDNLQQNEPALAAHYASIGQAVIRYGDDVEKLTAAQAVAKYKPQVVVASWVTHLYQESRHEAGGSVLGVNEEAIIDSVEAYIFIGNRKVHAGKSIWSRPHTLIEPDWLFSRASNGSPDFIAVWGK